MLPGWGTLGYLLQEGHSLWRGKPAELPPRPPTETMHLLTNCCDDAAILELGPIQRGQGLNSRPSHLILEKTPSKTACHGQQCQTPRTAGPGYPGGWQDDPGAEAGPQQRAWNLLGPAGSAPGTQQYVTLWDVWLVLHCPLVTMQLQV